MSNTVKLKNIELDVGGENRYLPNKNIVLVLDKAMVTERHTIQGLNDELDIIYEDDDVRWMFHQKLKEMANNKETGVLSFQDKDDRVMIDVKMMYFGTKIGLEVVGTEDN